MLKSFFSSFFFNSNRVDVELLFLIIFYSDEVGRRKRGKFDLNTSGVEALKH